MTKPNGKLKSLIPVLLFLPISLILSGLALATRRFSLLALTLLLFSGLVSWGIVEYVLHRFIFHYEAVSERGKAVVYAMHLSHHENPKGIEKLFAGLRTNVSVAMVYFMLAWIVLGNWQAAALLFTGLTTGYFCYEYVHYQAHHASPRLRVLRYLKKYHMLHHHQSPDARFGVTTPLFDILLGTYRPVRKQASQTTLI